MRHRRIILACLVPAILLGQVLVLASPAAAGGFCRGVPVTTAKGRTVEMSKNCFRPTVLHAAPGEPITFVNHDPEAHTVTGAGEWGTGHGEILTGDTAKIRLQEPGLYLYTCLLHPGMMGAVYVGGKGITVAEGTPTADVYSAEDSEPEAIAGSGSDEVEELQAEQVAATEEVPGAPASTVIGLGLAALGVGFVLGRVLRRTERPRDG
jgi:plastocyanin